MRPPNLIFYPLLTPYATEVKPRPKLNVWLIPTLSFRAEQSAADRASGQAGRMFSPDVWTACFRRRSDSDRFSQ